jgi:hypothetical protein
LRCLPPGGGHACRRRSGETPGGRAGGLAPVPDRAGTLSAMSGSKVWYCSNCGYETDRRGRCHLCRQRLEASPLAELEPAENEEDEVGYRMEDWADTDRGRLIVVLIRAHVLHRFEDDELVVDADDEEKVDGLLADLREVLARERGEHHAGGEDEEPEVEDEILEPEEPEEEHDEPATGEVSDWTGTAVRGLHDAALRLREDPTDMQADSDVAEFSAGVFATDEFRSIDPDTWAAVGRVTRRLLGALGADEALEDEIRTQAGVLVKLLQPTVDPEAAEESRLVRANGSARRAGPTATMVEQPEADDALTATPEEDALAPETLPEADEGEAVAEDGVTEHSSEALVDQETADLDAAAERAEESGNRRQAKRLRQEARQRLRLLRRGERRRPAEQVLADTDEDEEGDEGAAEDLDVEAKTDTGIDEDVGEEVDEEDQELDDEAPDEEDLVSNPLPAAGATDSAAEVVYELPDWLPEQRANLSVMLDAEDVPHDWDGGNLVVSGEREAEADAVFERIEGTEGLGVEDEEARYRTLEELFAAADRLARDPVDEVRRADAREAVIAADGPTPVGLDDVVWWQIRSRARSLLEALDAEAGPAPVVELAGALRDRLRRVV